MLLCIHASTPKLERIIDGMGEALQKSQSRGEMRTKPFHNSYYTYFDWTTPYLVIDVKLVY